MQLRQSLMLDLELDPSRRVYFDYIHKFPGNNLRRNLPGESVKRISGKDTEQQSSHCTTEANFDFAYAQILLFVAGEPLKIHIIHPDDLAPVDIDDLLIQKVLFQ